METKIDNRSLELSGGVVTEWIPGRFVGLTASTSHFKAHNN